MEKKNPKNIKMSSRRNLTPDDQEKALLQLQNITAVTTTTTPPEVEEKDVVRISIDIPRPLYEKVKKEAKLRGYSMRAFFVQRGWEYFEQA
jgi:hypothetical protein